jgi:hypothetical protein
MKVKTNKFGEVRIRWQYNLTDGDRDVTKVFLEQKIDKECVVLKEAKVVRNPKEKYDKEKARVFALQALVKESFSILKEVDGKTIYTRSTQDLADRKIIWKTYKERKTTNIV